VDCSVFIRGLTRAWMQAGCSCAGHSQGPGGAAPGAAARAAREAPSPEAAARRGGRGRAAVCWLAPRGRCQRGVFKSAVLAAARARARGWPAVDCGQQRARVDVTGQRAGQAAAAACGGGQVVLAAAASGRRAGGQAGRRAGGRAGRRNRPRARAPAASVHQVTRAPGSRSHPAPRGELKPLLLLEATERAVITSALPTASARAPRRSGPASM
jgi:hypothetical protein